MPTNAWHQFFNASLSRPARWFSVTDLPQLLRQWASEDFIFNNSYDFTDRYAGGADYFTADAKLYRGRVWETNFIPDIKKLPLYEWKSRGGGGQASGGDYHQVGVEPMMGATPRSWRR